MKTWLAQLKAFLHWMRTAVTQPREELDRWEAAIRYAYDLGRFGATQLRYDRAPQMAAALAFRTLFSLLPVFVVSTVLVNAFKGEEAFMEMLTRLFSELGLYEITASGEAQRVEPAATSLGAWLEDLITQASGMNLSAIGWVGLAVLLYSAISLMATVENSFNVVYRASEGRNWLTRVPTYFTTLLGWPVAVAIIMYVDATFTTKLEEFGAWSWILSLAPMLWSFVAIWLVMTVVYNLVPNTDVQIRPAMIGAFVASILLGVGWGTMSAYLENALSIQHLYGSLGLIPLFMFWVYLMWLVILFGLEVSATVQKLGGRRLAEMRAQQGVDRGLFEPTTVLNVMVQMAEDFAAGEPTTIQNLGQRLGIRESNLQTIAEALARGGFVHRVAGVDGGFSPSRPVGSIPASEVLEVGFGLISVTGSGTSDAIQKRLREAQIEQLKEVTVHDLASIRENLSASDKVAH